jgi:NAD(P)H-dependent glutamate synthase small subunit
MREEGVRFVTNAHIGVSHDAQELLDEHDAVVLCTGATQPRDLAVPGRALQGVHFAMEFLTANTRSLLDSNHEDARFINAAGKNVIVIGGGDTGNDCLGTSMRHGCQSLVNFEIMPRPPESRAANNPWPQWPRILRVDYGHEEATSAFGHDPREFQIVTKEFLGDGHGRLRALQTVRVEWVRDNGRMAMKEMPGTEQEWPAELCFLALGFLGPEETLVKALGLKTDPRSNYQADYGKFRTSLDKVFAAGDCRRGQSLVVWAINEGRGAAREVDRFLMGSTRLPG